VDLLVNVDVPDLVAAIAFYQGAFGLTVTRRFGADGAAEPVPRVVGRVR